MVIRTLLFINSLLLVFSFGKKITSTVDNNPHVYKLPTIIASPDMFCDGTLGENIFTDGDFGSGFQTNLPTDANNYAPGYNYQSTPPPNDGNYIITNNTSAWGSFAASSWINIGDNSNDPNGYMMVVNASYDPSNFYEKTITGLCENTLYQFSADVINLLTGGGIKPNLDFVIDGSVQYSTGEIPADQTWNTYGFTFTTAPGTTSLNLAIRNNAPGGAGNDLAIDNIEFRTCGPETIIKSSIPFICEGISASVLAEIIGTQYPTPFYQWQLSIDGGATWNNVVGENNEELFLATPTDGFQYRLLVSNSSATIDNEKCRIISNIHEVEITPIDFVYFDTLCQGLSLEVGNSSYSTAGIYVDSFFTSYGCDSIVISNLEFVSDQGISADIEVTNPSCANSASGTINVSNVQNGSGIYTYYLNEEYLGDIPFFEYIIAGNYTVRIVDHYGCEVSYDVAVIDPVELTVDLGDDVTILLGESYDIVPQTNLPTTSFVWLNSNGLECTIDCFNPTVFPIETTNYPILVTNAEGCTATDSITIAVDKTRRVFIPNAFSPDADGYNDYFTIYSGVGVEEILNFQIFNRWGSLVFSKNNFQGNLELEGWDGTFKGKKMDSGVYIYTVEILFKDGLTERFSGDVTIVE